MSTESQSTTNHTNYSQTHSSGSSHGGGGTPTDSARAKPWVSGKWGLFPVFLTEFTAKAIARNGGEFIVNLEWIFYGFPYFSGHANQLIHISNEGGMS